MSQLQEPYSSVGYLCERVSFLSVLKLKHPSLQDGDQDNQSTEGLSWTAWDVCEGNVGSLAVSNHSTNFDKVAQLYFIPTDCRGGASSTECSSWSMYAYQPCHLWALDDLDDQMTFVKLDRAIRARLAKRRHRACGSSLTSRRFLFSTSLRRPGLNIPVFPTSGMLTSTFLPYT